MVDGGPERGAVERLVRDVVGERLDARLVGEGGEHSTWWVGDRYVLRLALDADTSRRQRVELALRDAVRPRVGAETPDTPGVGVAESVAAGEWAPGLAYTVDVRLPGTSAELRDVSSAGERDLARLLSGLRSAPVDEAAALGLPREPPRSLASVREDAARAAGLLRGGGEPVAAEPPRADGEAAGGPVVLHHDLKGEHLLVDGRGRVSGVLDWTDAAVGDPAEDVAGLAISVGAPAAARIAVAAGHTAEVAARGVLLARYDTLVRLADRLHGTDDSPVPLLRAQLARAWRD